MLKKIYQIIFIGIFAVILSAPLICANWSSQGISVDENRNLASLPELFSDGKFNEEFTVDAETWFMDHMGNRQQMINWNAALQYYVFDRIIDTHYYLGAGRNLNYAPRYMIDDYAHINLRSKKEVCKIGKAYQTVSDWCEERGVQYYYVQCYDKHSIYPEQFLGTIRQIGEVSKTDQIIDYMEDNTSVHVVSLKQAMIDGKKEYETYSNWGDPTHWTPRGAVIGYQTVMGYINANNSEDFMVLKEEDFEIKIVDGGRTINKYIHVEDMLESLTLKKPQAVKGETAVLGKWSDDKRHSVWYNPNVGNSKKLLIMGDSYFNNYIVDDFAESFSEVWLVWGDYTTDFCEIVDMYQPDIVIYECAERVDRSNSVINLAKAIRKKETEGAVGE